MPSRLERNRGYDAKYRAENRIKFRALKECNPCARCGKYYPHFVMEFHHLSEKHKHGIYALMARWNRVLEEIAKCELLCANCHKYRTHEKDEAK